MFKTLRGSPPGWVSMPGPSSFTELSMAALNGAEGIKEVASFPREARSPVGAYVSVCAYLSLYLCVS